MGSPRLAPGKVRRVLVLPSGQVTLWRARPRLQPAWIGLLDDAERGRLERFHRPEDGARFLTGATMVRRIFAADLGIPAAQVRLDRTCPDCHQPHGKVQLASRRLNSVQVSVSHSGDCVIVAAMRGASIGVDIEQVNPCLDHLALGRLVLRAEELCELASVAERDRAACFTTYWARKEAVVKAIGSGLRIPLRELAVSGSATATLTVAWPGRAGRFERVHLVDLKCTDAYRAALAVLNAPLTRVVSEDPDCLLTTTAE